MADIKSILQKHNIHPNKFMGQNFLIDENILNKIIETADIEKDDTILEIGPGLGILTIELAKRAKQIIAIEKDKKMCEILKNVLIDQGVVNVEIVNADILKYKILNTNYKVIANIPYYLTSPLIRMFLEAEHRPTEIILMIQKEVAERICAIPPPKSPKAIGPELRSSSRAKMSILSVSVQFYAKPEIISYVPKTSFYPAPKVDSAIIKIIPRTIPDIDKEKFFRLVKKGFASKRKMLKNNIPEIDSEKLGLNPNIRAENLTIDDWIKIYEQFNF